MTDPQDKETGQSRRAKRRAGQQTEEAAAAPESAAERAEEADPSLDAEADVSGDDDAEAGDIAPSKAKKKKKAAAVSTEEIRDRNKRLREEAAARRRAKRDSGRKVAQAQGLDASEIVDDALMRSAHAVTTWLKRHFNVVQWVIVVGLAVGIGWQIYSYSTKKRRAKHTDVLVEALHADTARVGGEDTGPDKDTGLEDTRATFATDEARLKESAARYQKALSQSGSDGAAALAKLGLAGVRYEQRKYAEAKDLYEQVRSSKIAAEDQDIKGRALEGIGLSMEAKGDRASALKAFKELENSDIWGMAPLGLYHQARLHLAQNDKKKAKELLEKAGKQLEKQRTPTQPEGGYLDTAIRELMSVVDPASVAAAPQGMSPEQLQRLRQQISDLSNSKDPKQLEKLLKDATGQGGPIPTPPGPEPAGSAP